MNHSLRTVFLSGTNSYVSNREILVHIFSPTRLELVEKSPQELLESKLGDLDP